MNTDTESVRVKRIWIEPYYRVRDGKIQHVRGHWRKSPHKRGSATVIAFPGASVA
jgi:hypothetical protein